MSIPLLIIIQVLTVGFLIALLGRTFWLWYWKVNKISNSLDEIKNILAEIKNK